MPKIIVAVIMTSLLAGCVSFGPEIVRTERSDYNQAVGYTNSEQLLLNVVRAHRYEPPVFNYLQEYDVTPSVGFSLAGGPSNLGAVPIGALAAGVSASQTSLQKNVSLTNYETTQQISKPITLQSIFRLENSNNPTIPTLVFSVNRFGHRYDEYFRIVDLIYFLDLFGALSTESRNENTLSLMFEPKGAIAHPNRDNPEDDPLSCVPGDVPYALQIKRLWSSLVAALDARGATDRIVLRSTDAKLSGLDKLSEVEAAAKPMSGSLVLTRTAQGALRTAEGDAGYIRFMDVAQAAEVRAANTLKHDGDRHAPNCGFDEFYFVTDVRKSWKRFFADAFDADGDPTRYETRRAGEDSVMIIVEKSLTRPVGAYVTVFDRGQWYAINEGDVTSKKNFALLNAILIIQAVQSMNTPTPTTLSVGKGG